MEKKRRIPYGVINWAKLVRECKEGLPASPFSVKVVDKAVKP